MMFYARAPDKQPFISLPPSHVASAHSFSTPSYQSTLMINDLCMWFVSVCMCERVHVEAHQNRSNIKGEKNCLWSLFVLSLPPYKMSTTVNLKHQTRNFTANFTSSSNCIKPCHGLIRSKYDLALIRGKWHHCYFALW